MAGFFCTGGPILPEMKKDWLNWRSSVLFAKSSRCTIKSGCSASAALCTHSKLGMVIGRGVGNPHRLVVEKVEW